MRKEHKLGQLEFEFMGEIKANEEPEIRKERWEYHKRMLIGVIPALPLGVAWYLVVNKSDMIKDFYNYVRGLF